MEAETPACMLGWGGSVKDSVDQMFKLHISDWLSLDHEFAYKSSKSNKSDAPFPLGLVCGVHKVWRLFHTLTSLPECLSPNSHHLSNKLKCEGVKWKVFWQVLSWCSVWPDNTVIKGWVITCMTVPYLTTSPCTFLFSVSFCFCSRLEACCNTNTHTHKHTLSSCGRRLPVTQKSLTRCKVKRVTPDQVNPVGISSKAFSSIH